MSGSVARFVMVTVTPAKFVCIGRSATTGARFTSRTKIVKLVAAVKGGTPSSATCTGKVLVLGPCASVGIQETTPLGLTEKPRGPETKLYVRVPPSGSLARRGSVNVVCSLTV